MLIIMLLEVGMVLDIPFAYYNLPLGIFLAVEAFTAVLQLAGILMVASGLYRSGAVLEFIASAIHLLDITGILGIVGARKAYKYPERLSESQA
ncbi:MAG: hypothetical protein JRJ60_05975 [Deltaproteobacteria bacterium]|nr:hypothetical protein [Deltaproteobacteria bacterium]